MTDSSIKAWYDKSFAESRAGLKKRLEQVFAYSENEHTIREMSNILGLSYNSVQKRMSDLYKENRIIITGSKKEEGTDNSKYKYNQFQKLLISPKRTDAELMQQAMNKYITQDVQKAVYKYLDRLKKKRDERV